ncbi:hypothetical protein GCM10009599_19880 [Luteococcus peritonei]
MNGQGPDLLTWAPLLRGLLATDRLPLLEVQPEAPRDASATWRIEASGEPDLEQLRGQLAAHRGSGPAPEHVVVEGLGHFRVQRGPWRSTMDGRVVLVTGAAQGFGRQIAANLAAQGARLVLGDVNLDGVRRAAAELCQLQGAGRAVAVGLDVADPGQTREALRVAVQHFGGVDLFVANAGIVRAGAVTELDPDDFDLVTRVNYRGYFVGVQAVAPVMALQHTAAPEHRFDIVEVNSKSGLTGSNRNGAYAGSKFGGIGLTQSFALELASQGIKVNAVCPGNYLDGPLWSDPERGLFVQYLAAGKVPGARTVQDIRRHYESQVPLGRGCRPEDVVRAICYAVEQQYETGQAIPVTGGQTMLH